jgi:hypothetical protein
MLKFLTMNNFARRARTWGYEIRTKVVERFSKLMEIFQKLLLIRGSLVEIERGDGSRQGSSHSRLQGHGAPQAPQPSFAFFLKCT